MTTLQTSRPFVGGLLPACLLAVFAACGDHVSAPDTGTPQTAVDTETFESSISHATNGGNEHFTFLPPLVKDPQPSGEFDSSFLPYLRVAICEWDGGSCVGNPVATFTSEGAPASGTVRIDQSDKHYIANWHSAASGAVVSKSYRISVSVGDIQLGFVNVRISETGKNKSSKRRIAREATVPIKFRIERGIAGALVVNSSGGTVSSKDQKARITIPQGALDREKLVTVAESDASPPPLFADDVIDDGYDLTVEGGTFQKPVSVNLLTNTEGDLDLDGIGVLHFTEDSSLAAIKPAEKVHAKSALKFKTQSFSHYTPFASQIKCPQGTWCTHGFTWEPTTLTWFLDLETGGSLTPWAKPEIVEQAVQRWASVSGLDFKRVFDRQSANIIFEETDTEKCPSDKWSPHNQLLAPNGITCLPPRMLRTDERTLTSTSAVLIKVRARTAFFGEDEAFETLMHEIGHGIGVAHTARRAGDCSTGPLPPVMQARRCTEERRQLHKWDEEAIRFLYPQREDDATVTQEKVVNSFASAFDDYILYTGLLTDEFVHSGTFPCRREVQNRAVSSENICIETEVFNPLDNARTQADLLAENSQAELETGEVRESELRERIAVGKYFGGVSRILMSEGFCRTSLDEGPASSSTDRMHEALTLLEEAITEAQNAGTSTAVDIETAARVGKARASLWLGDLNAARAAAQIPSGFQLT